MSDPFVRTNLFLRELSDDPAGLAGRLSAQSVLFRLARPTPAAEITVATAATLLLRMDRAAPAVGIVSPDGRVRGLPRLGDGPLVDALAREHERFTSVERLAAGAPARPDVELAFDGETTGLRVGSNGWVAGVDVDLGEGGNPVAAVFAGMLAANEALKFLLAGAGVPLLREPRSWRGAVSLWDYTLEPVDSGPEIPDVPLSLAGIGFVGCGGISAATFWTLAMFRLAGRPFLIDDDHVDITNLNRLLYANVADCGREKVAVVKQLLDVAGTDAEPLARRWEQLSQKERHAVDLAVVTVDKDDVRRQIQESMPRLILNGGTSDSGEYRVSRHDFLNRACLSCISHGDKTARSLEEQLARFLGLPFVELAPHFGSAEPLPDVLIEAAKVTPEVREELRALPARRLGPRFCDELAVVEGDAVSAPTLSAAPGILLASEVVKFALDTNPALDERNVVHASVLSGPHKRWLMQLEKRDGCVCGDEVYRAHYSRRHP